MAACTDNQLQKTMKQLKDATTTNSKSVALTSFRRVYLKDLQAIKTLNDEEFCELCNSVIDASTAEDEKLHIEACRTLDIILPETTNRNIDFFQSILQINRKKRLKVLVSLSILKDETVAMIANKLSILSFLNDCMQSIKIESMTWLLPENADNAVELNKMERKTLNENEEFEEKIVERTLQFLDRLCHFSSFGLNIRMFDTLIMQKVILLAYMGLRRQRIQALNVLKQAVKNDLGVRVRSIQKDLWDAYKTSLQNVYCKRMTLLVNNNDQDWASQWEISITFIGTDLHRGSGLVNSLLKVEELAFKSADPNRRQAFISWKVLIDNFALDQRELATNRRIKLLCVPLNAKNSKTELMVLTKLEVWWHLIYKVYPSISECVDTVLVPFLNMCFGPFGDKPLFIQKTDTNVSLGKKFAKTQIFGIYAFMQLIVNKEDHSTISSSIVQDVLPNPISNSMFLNIYKILIHCFGEILLSMGLLTDLDVKNKAEICSILWDSLIKRIEEYDKMKVSMYKEIMNVIAELIQHRFYKIPMIRDFLLNKILTNIESISTNMQFSETSMMDFVQTILQVDNFSYFTSDHYKSIESLLWHLIKPKNADAFYPKSMELMQDILKILDDAKNINSNRFATCELWCILGKIAKKYIEDSQSVNEGTYLANNFKTIESIIAFPFTHLFIDDNAQLKKIAETWISLYKQFDFQTELIVTVQSNEIMNQTSRMIISALKKNKKSCDLAAICIDGLLATVNYDNLPSDKEVPAIVQLLKDLIFQCLQNKSFASDRILKAFCAFLLRVFSHSAEKTANFLKMCEPAVKYILTKTDDNSLDCEINNTWSTIVGLFKKLQKSLDFELISIYRKTIVLAMLHLNKDISSMAFSILDMKDSVDEKSKKLLEEIIHELEETSIKSNIEIEQFKEKSNKKTRSHQIKSTGSFLNRKSLSPSSTKKDNGKENFEKPKVINIEPDSQDFVVINTDVKLDVSRLTEHQKEMLKKRREDIPAMYNDLTVSNTQDSQELQHWFDVKTGKSTTTTVKQSELLSNNNETSKSASTTSVHFKNIAQVFNVPEKVPDKPVISPKTLTPRAGTKKQQQVDDGDVSTIADSQQVKVVSAPVVAKKLDFESREEFPADTEQQISPSIIDNAKMRRRHPSEDTYKSVAENTDDKNIRTTRRSLNPQQQGITLRKFSSNEQLNTKRGRKRRNSETNSESALDIEREKRPRRDHTPDELSSGESSKSNEGNTTNIDGKKYTKRQLSEMSRLKIDMRFEPLPSRRSASKLNENATPHVIEKKSTVLKDDKCKEEKIPANTVKSDMNQLSVGTITRRSMSKTVIPTKSEAFVKEVEKHKRDSGHKKPAAPEHLPENNKLTTRKSLGSKTESIATVNKNVVVAETQEETEATQMEIKVKKPEDGFGKHPETIIDEIESESMRSQDSDIVESSQDPSTNSKLDKIDECFIKIKKVHVLQTAKNTTEEMQMEKESNIIEATPVEVDETSVSIIPATIEFEKSVPVQTEPKKIDNIPAGKLSHPLNHISSPKSSNTRSFRPKHIQGRAAQMLGLVTKLSIAEKLASEVSKSDSVITDEITIVPISKKDKVSKESDRVCSPSTGSSSGGSRQEKMFSNMNSIRQDRCSSPLMTMFCNLKNDGERISPKLDKHERDTENGAELIENETQNNGERSCNDNSPNGKGKKELPLLEWSNANPPSLTASPSASILKRMQEIDADTPNRKKRVSFADPPVSREMGYEIMTESASPPKLEKLPTIRSPVSRKESRKYTRQRLIQMDLEKTEKENNELISNVESNPTEPTVVEPIVNVSSDVSPKVKLITVLSEISLDESKILEVESQAVINTQEVDMFINNNADDIIISTNSESREMVQTSTQNDQNNSSIKLDSINLSNILHKFSDNATSLEDTVDVDNMSSSLEGTSNLSDKAPMKTSSQQSTDPGDTLPVTDSLFSNLPLSQETQNSVAQLIQPEALDSTLPVYPSLVSCVDNVESVSAELVDPLFTNNLAKHLSIKSIRSVGDLAQLTERDVNRLPIKSPKIACVKKALSRYEEKLITRTPEKKSSKAVSSSTPLGNKSKDSKIRLNNDSFEDLIKNASNNSDLVSTNVSDVYECKRPKKRQSTNNSTQMSPIKRSKKDNEESFTKLMDQCDEAFLYNAFMKRFNAEKILEGYREKMTGDSDDELKKKTLEMLGLSEVDDSEASFKASSKSLGLEKVLQQLPKIFDSEEEFYDLVLKTYNKSIKIANVLEMQKPNEIKELIKNKFSSSDLLSVLAKKLSQRQEKCAKEFTSNSKDFKVVLDNTSPDLILDYLLARNDLKFSEELLNIALENTVDKFSENTKKAMYKTLTDKLDVCELADMYNEAIKSGVRKLQRK